MGGGRRRNEERGVVSRSGAVRRCVGGDGARRGTERCRGQGRRPKLRGGDGNEVSEGPATIFSEELLAACLVARVRATCARLDHLRDELHDETLCACAAGDAALGLASDRALLATGGAIEREAAVALLHLVAELNIERFAANAAGLVHRGHGSSGKDRFEKWFENGFRKQCWKCFVRAKKSACISGP